MHRNRQLTINNKINQKKPIWFVRCPATKCDLMTILHSHTNQHFETKSNKKQKPKLSQKQRRMEVVPNVFRDWDYNEMKWNGFVSFNRQYSVVFRTDCQKHLTHYEWSSVIAIRSDTKKNRYLNRYLHCVESSVIDLLSFLALVIFISFFENDKETPRNEITSLL